MKKIIPLIITLLLALPFSAQPAETNGVVVSIKPLHSLVQNVIGNTGVAELLVDGGASPHDYQLKPSQMDLLQSSSVVFYLDESFESFLSNAFSVIPSATQKVSVIDESGVKLLNRRTGGAWEAHSHDDAEVDHHHAGADMHVWLDPKNAILITRTITRRLADVYPENREIFESNANKLIARLQHLDDKLAAQINLVKDEPYIVFHDAFQYFEKRYGTSVVGSITLDPTTSPSIYRITEIRNKIKEVNAVCIFSEPKFSEKLINTVSEGMNLRNGKLDPEGLELEAGYDLYFLLMENLARNLTECLK